MSPEAPKPEIITSIPGYEPTPVVAAEQFVIPPMPESVQLAHDQRIAEQAATDAAEAAQAAQRVGKFGTGAIVTPMPPNPASVLGWTGDVKH